MAIEVLGRGIDYSGLRPDPHDVARNGATFIVRYSAGAGVNDPNAAFKLCGLHEIQDAVAAGLDFIANSEWYESRITEGALAGTADGAADLHFWQERGYHRGAVIIVSWDEGQPDATKHAAIEAYLTAYAHALGGYYRVGLYAGDVALRAMFAAKAISVGWRAMADSWSGPGNYYQPGAAWKAAAEEMTTRSPAHLWQNGNRWYGDQADEDVVLRLPVFSHLAVAAQPHPEPNPAPTPNPGPRPDRTYVVVPGDTLWAIAQRFDTTVENIVALNPTLTNPDLIFPGQRITIPPAPG